MLLISAATTGEAGMHRTAIEAARDAGAGRIVYTSHMGASSTSPFAPMLVHAATETMLQESGVPFTSLRNGFYVASARMLLGQALGTGVLAAPEDGPVSWTAHADLAEAAAIVLTKGGIEGPTPAFTGAEALDFAELAEIVSELTGRPITRTVVSDQEYRAALVAHGAPEDRADMLLGMFAASRLGDFAAVDPTLDQLLGHPPTAARDALAGTL